MSKRIEVIKKQKEDIWKWAGTRKSSISCVEKLVDEIIDDRMKRFEEMGEELLDFHVYRLEVSYPFVAIEFLSRPKQEKE